MKVENSESISPISNEAPAPTRTPSETTNHPQVNRQIKSRVIKILSFVILAAAIIFLWRYFGNKPENAAPRNRTEVAPVTIAAATQMDIPIQIKGIGTVEAISTISVRSQIEGTLERVYFTPGQEVKQGDLLFTIDPRPLQAALAQAQANLDKSMTAVKQAQAVVARDQATANNARLIVSHDVPLVESGVISREEYENAVAQAKAAEATVSADQSAVNNMQADVKAQQAAVQNARVQLSYTQIRSPISGKTGNLAVTAGNLVQPNGTTPLVTITQTTPIYATFSVPEQDLPRIRNSSGSKDFKVEVSVPGDESATEIGNLSLVDNTVDPTTGTIKLKATFLNQSRKLFPGQFVNVVLTLGIQRNAVVVPSQAVQIGQDNAPFVYVVKPDMTVETRKVKTGATIDNMTVIDEGLQAGEQVVTDGQLRIVPGAKVQPVSGGGAGGGRAGGGGGNRGGGQANSGAAGPASTNPSGNAPGNTGNGGQGNPGANGGAGGAGTGGTGTGGGTGGAGAGGTGGASGTGTSGATSGATSGGTGGGTGR